MQIDVVEAPPGGVEADVLVFAVRDPVALTGAARGSTGWSRAVWPGSSTPESSGGTRAGSRSCTRTAGWPPRASARSASAAGRSTPTACAPPRRASPLARSTSAATSVAWVVEENGLPAEEQGRAIVDGTVLGPYANGRWKTGDERPRDRAAHPLRARARARPREAARRANVAAAWANRCRDVVNAPANELTPEGLAAWAEEIAGGERAPPLRGARARGDPRGRHGRVRRGQPGEPQPAAADHAGLRAAGRGADRARVGLVGKAITFDAGGLSLKPAYRMDEMKSDMGGGGAVLAAMGAIAELELPVRILAVVPSCENLPSGHAFRPGDIVTALNGKTIEISNTDAEGRLILADALWYARESGATHVLDLATLTGGIVVAMGDLYAGLFGNDEDWCAEIAAAAEASGDHAWRLPLHERYHRYNDSPFADLKNSSDYRQASPILAAAFLETFAGEGPWAHLDIAGTAYLERGRGDYYSRLGATGYGVRLLAELARRLSA